MKGSGFRVRFRGFRALGFWGFSFGSGATLPETNMETQRRVL